MTLFQTLQLVAIILFIILMLMYLSVFFMPKKKEGFTGDKIYTMPLGGYNRLCKVGKSGIWYDCSRGAGQYITGYGGEQGFYEGGSSETDISGVKGPKTPECMKANCGRFDVPKNPQGCGCSSEKGQVCCGKDVGCKAKIDPSYIQSYDCNAI